MQMIVGTFYGKTTWELDMTARVIYVTFHAFVRQKISKNNRTDPSILILYLWKPYSVCIALLPHRGLPAACPYWVDTYINVKY